MVRIVIDSACDMELSRAEELGLDFMPLKTIFGEDEYLDGVIRDFPLLRLPHSLRTPNTASKYLPYLTHSNI